MVKKGCKRGARRAARRANALLREGKTEASAIKISLAGANHPERTKKRLRAARRRRSAD